jgi:hypothetical protein
MNRTIAAVIGLLAVFASSNCFDPTDAVPKKEQKEDKPPAAVINPISQDDLNDLLSKRLESGMGLTFASFSNMFFVHSHQLWNRGVGLATDSQKIAESTLQSPFPRFYKSTLREFLDAIALQCSAKWKFDPSSKFVKNLTKRQSPKDLAIFEFVEYSERPKPYDITLPKGWTTKDHGNWVQCVPEGKTVGVDIYESGAYSADNKGDEAELFKKVSSELSLEWAKRVSPKSSAKDMKTGKVGQYDAICFDAMVPSRANKNVRWRQWIFFVGNKCYFIVSTIFPEDESKIFPEVQSILQSFKAKG